MNDIAIFVKKQVVELTGRSYSSLRRDIANGAFPAPVQIGPRQIGWRASEIRAWVDGLQRAALPAVGKPHASGVAKSGD